MKAHCRRRRRHCRSVGIDPREVSIMLLDVNARCCCKIFWKDCKNKQKNFKYKKKNYTSDMINLTFSQNNVFIWNACDWLTLRKEHRIIGELVGCLAKYPRQEVLSGLPLLLFPEEVSLLLEKGIARVVKYSHLQYPPSESLKETFDQYREILFKEQEKCLKEEKEKQIEAMMDKIVEGKKRKILGMKTNKKKLRKPLDKDSQEALKNVKLNTKDLFDEQMSKLPKLEKSEALIQTHTAYPQWNKGNFEIVQWKYPNTPQEKLRYETFKDLWERGYYITTGEKFGGDFLLYPGDPIMFHSQFIIQCKNRSEEIPITELVGQCRTASHVRKVQVFATFSEDGKSVKYQSFKWAENNGFENR
ncbi:PREDICTED: tRNA-splicing endonuclease subunit Sen34 [Polistes dominula]|uniref:tRNA-splicing endonuclease subunit Sen34 n=1 Tax=Polistes dominula TaxID=743375 RepID=A0ABM1IL28_POLDO|nr:PREDICTED: tRNA-splicing endonuclease subunit Sen34 [Polistes dominula]